MLYKIISGSDVGKLEIQVNSHIEQGWELYSLFQVASFTNEHGVMDIMLFQPILYKEGLNDEPTNCEMPEVWGEGPGV